MSDEPIYNEVKCYSIEDIALKIKRSEVVAYPTEAVFGLGCCPKNEKAVMALLDLKQRPVSKGLILVAEHFDMLLPYIDLSQLSPSSLEKILASWPGPVTWVMPAKACVPSYLKGDFDSIAVRVSSHPTIQALSRAIKGPLVSTSANITGYLPAKKPQEVYAQFGERVSICEGKLGDLSRPTMIKEALTLQILRD